MGYVTVTSGDIFLTRARVLVNPVNCVGVMGAGLALQFARRFPSLVTPYQQACRSGELRVGSVFSRTVYDQGEYQIICVPTKIHWRQSSTLSIVEAGLHALIDVVEAQGSPLLALPALGCGLGGLSWYDQVLPLTVRLFRERLPNGHVLLLEPQ